MLRKHNIPVYDWGLGEIWNESFSLLHYVAPDDVRKGMVTRFEELGLRNFKYHTPLVKALKLLGDHAKRFGDSFSVHWKWFVNWDMLWKYGSTYDAEELYKDILDWFGPKEMRGTTDDNFYRFFRKNVENFFNMYWKKPLRQPLNWRRWIRSGNWGTTGASDLGRAKVEINGKVVKAAKTKNASVMVADLDKLEKILYENNPQHNIISVKPDEAPNKTRLIASSDGPCYLLMSFLSQHFTEGYSGKVSTLYKSTRSLADFWLSVISRVGSTRTMKCPLDQKGFDHHATRNMIAIILDVMETKCYGEGDFLLAIKQLRVNLLSEKASWEFKSGKTAKSGLWQAGIPSGWRWTADMDTIINYAEFYTIIDLLMTVDKRVDIWNDCFQGDDVQLELLSKYQAACVIAGYDLVGLEVNKGKFFVDDKRDEFLRKVAVRGKGLSGYPARSIHSLLWRVPGAINVDYSNPGEILDIWLILIRRGADNARVVRCMIEDMQGILKISKDDIWDWIHTPSSLGGGGIYNRFVTRWVKIVNKKVEEDWVLDGKNVGLQQMCADWKIVLDNKELAGISKAMTKPANMRVERGSEVKVEDLVVEENLPLQPRHNFLYVASAIWKSAFPNFLRPVLISRIRSRGDIHIVEEFLEDKCLMTLTRLKSNASMGVIKEWLQGGFKKTLPRMVNVSQDIISGVYSDYDIWMNAAMGLRNLTQATVKRVRLWIEIQIATSQRLEKLVQKAGCVLRDIMIGG